MRLRFPVGVEDEQQFGEQTSMKSEEDWFRYFAEDKQAQEVAALPQTEEAFFGYMCKAIQLDAKQEGVIDGIKKAAKLASNLNMKNSKIVAREILSLAEQVKSGEVKI